MAAARFVERLSEQIAYEFAASQQYIANAVYYDGQTLPQLATFFYAQAVEERNHAMMMVRYLLDADATVSIPGVAAPETQFADVIAPVALALEQEKRVSDQIASLTHVAREERDYLSEQFLQWFLKEQVEEVASMSSLLTVVKRSGDSPMLIEDYLAREHSRNENADPTAPPAAGGALSRSGWQPVSPSHEREAPRANFPLLSVLRPARGLRHPQPRLGATTEVKLQRERCLPVAG